VRNPIRYSPDENGILVEGDHGSLISVADYNILSAENARLRALIADARVRFDDIADSAQPGQGTT